MLVEDASDENIFLVSQVKVGSLVWKKWKWKWVCVRYLVKGCYVSGRWLLECCFDFQCRCCFVEIVEQKKCRFAEPRRNIYTRRRITKSLRCSRDLGSELGIHHLRTPLAGEKASESRVKLSVKLPLPALRREWVFFHSLVVNMVGEVGVNKQTASFTSKIRSCALLPYVVMELRQLRIYTQLAFAPPWEYIRKCSIYCKK